MSSAQEPSDPRPPLESFWRGMLDPQNLEDPYPSYARLREYKRVMRLPMGGDLAPWVVSGYDEVYRVLRDTRFSSAGRALGMRGNAAQAERYASQGGFGASMVSSDPPEHTRLRGLVSKAFTPRRISAMKDRLEEIVDELLAPATARGSIELMDEFAGPLPATVIGELLGVPREDHERFRRWSNEMFNRLGPTRETDGLPGGEAARSLAQYIGSIIAERRKNPSDDLISGMIAAQEERQMLTDAELLSTSFLLLIAGFETTTNLIGNGVLALLRHPEQLERLRADRELLPSAIEEFLRYDSPVQFLGRTTKEPVELGGESLPAKAGVMILLGSANRDPQQFPEPDRFDIGREDNAHVSFGWGLHHCLGAPLARLEGEVAFTALLDRFPEWRMEDGGLARRPNPMLRGLARLPLAF
jgi:pimeloyl-[acyl-carrier protein] synthase